MQSAIEYSGSAVPGLVKNNKIWMYNSIFSEQIKYYLKEMFSMVVEIKPADQLVGLWTSIDMFTHDRNSVIIIGDRNLRNWVIDETRKTRLKINITNEIKLKDDQERKEPFLYKDVTNNIYIVQNAHIDGMREALYIAYQWKVKSINVRNIPDHLIMKDIADVTEESKYDEIPDIDNIMNIDHIIYSLSNEGKIIPVEVKVSDESSKFLQILRYPTFTRTYAALLPVR